MCCNANHRYCCFFMGVVAIFVGGLEIGFKCSDLAWNGANSWLLAIVVAWIPIIIAAILLILGALKQIPRLLLVWIIVSLVCGIALVIIKSGLVINLYDYQISSDILLAILNVMFLLLVFVWAFYPYAYMRELKEQH
ncbi:hypothetical protein KR084_012976 [Drosophila pseudotakahashii]|nr:hypothetical protein KR084_012976 [Drosophila pseudotakahashii]